MTQAAPRVIVIGGSLGGLSAALSLRDAGCDVTVYERSQSPLTEQGAGIVLNPATVRYLVECHALDLSTISIRTNWLRYIDREGQIAHQQSVRYRFSSYNALYRSLLGCFDASQYQLGMQVAGFTQDEHGVTVLFANGQRQHCDLLVCADGIRSTGRRILLPSQTIRYAGYVAWRGVVAADQLDPALVELFGSAITYYVMPHSHLLIYPIPVIDSANGTLRLHLNWLWYRNVPAGIAFETLMTDREGTARDLSLPAGMVQPHKIEQLHDDASALPAPITQLLRATERPFIQAIVDLEIPQMAFGRICLIGDAAWVARPHAAAGSAKAAADAWQLGVALRAANFDVLAALQRWEPAQLELGQQVLARTRAAGQRAQFDQAWQIGDPLPFGLYAEGDSEI